MNEHLKDAVSGKEISPVLWKAGIRLILTTVVMLSILFLAAGRLDWWEAWAYAAMAMVTLISSRLTLILKNPELALERVEAASQENVKSWDKVLMPVTAILGPVLSWIIAGLDLRFGWSPNLPDSIQIIALGVIFLGSGIGSWAMIANRFFSSHVRIQTDRGHTVVSNGPYRVVRHPGYASNILAWVAAPIFFSSYWVIFPAVLVIIISIIRTAWEDQTLQDELPGYNEYAEQVKYRLFPGIW